MYLFSNIFCNKFSNGGPENILEPIYTKPLQVQEPIEEKILKHLIRCDNIKMWIE